MPLFVVTGGSGAGKSSSAIEDFIIGSGFTEFPIGLRSGQHVATGIEGMKDPARREKLRALVDASAGKSMPFDFDPYGNDELLKEGFWPRYTGEDPVTGVKLFDWSKCAVKPGSMVVVDEAAIFKEKNMPSAWVEHINYHRHWGSNDFPFVIVIIYQTWKELHSTVKGNAVYAYEYVVHSDDSKRRRFTFKAPGDIPRLVRSGNAALAETLPRNLAVRETYVSTVAHGAVARDNMAVSPWKALWRKHRKLLVGLILFGVLGTYWSVNNLVETYVEPNTSAAPASSSPGQAAPLTTTGPPSPAGPVVVGIVPGSGRSTFVIVSLGSEFRTVEAEWGKPIPFQGKNLPWPADY